MNKATAIACSNIALVKYMGRKDDVLRLPANGSVSMNLSGCRTTTTVEFSGNYQADELTINDQQETGVGLQKISAHLDRLRVIAHIDLRARVHSQNTFPRSTGLSSSASGFAALTVAAAGALGLQLSEAELSVLARQGSGSACRSIPGGFVEWLDAETSAGSYGVTRFAPAHWDVCDLVAVCTYQPKKVSSSDSHTKVTSSPLFAEWVGCKKERIQQVLAAIKNRDFSALGPIVEAESEGLHALYESVGIVQRTDLAKDVCRAVWSWRETHGLRAYYSLNTGQNVHVLCLPQDVARLRAQLLSVAGVQQIIESHPAPGASLSAVHLF
jgi:diphosphomevalonate decarboxylase